MPTCCSRTGLKLFHVNGNDLSKCAQQSDMNGSVDPSHTSPLSGRDVKVSDDPPTLGPGLWRPFQISSS